MTPRVLAALEYGGAAVLLIAGLYTLGQLLLARFYGESLEDKINTGKPGQHGK
jgi:hypothetical protein